MKRKIAGILIVMLIIVTATFKDPVDETEAMSVEELINSLNSNHHMNEEVSIELYHRLMSYYNSGDFDEIDRQKYSDHFGGAYIDETGMLHILIVEGDESEMETIKSVIGEKGYAISSCDYSYADLINTIYDIGECIPQIIDEGICLSSVREDVINNRVVIGIDGCTDEDIIKTRMIVDAPFLSFEDIAREVETGTPIKGGYKVDDLTNNDSSIVGFCARNSSNVEGFIISGHVGNTINEMFKYGSITAGHVTATAYYNSSNADAAFLAKGTNANVTDKIGPFTVHSVSTYATEYPVGTSVYMYNSSKNVVSGTIQSLYKISGGGNVYLYNQTLTSYNSEEGDSGSPVIIIQGVINGVICCKILGIQSRRGIVNGEVYSIFSKYNYINSELGAIAITS
jgi:hypothetical protein